MFNAENQSLIKRYLSRQSGKCVCGALDRHFCQTRVGGSGFLSCVYILSNRQHVCNEVELVLYQMILLKQVLIVVLVCRL